MDARSGYMFENIIAKIFCKAGYAIKQDVQLEQRSGDIDIVDEKEGNSYCIKVKYSQLIEKAAGRPFARSYEVLCRKLLENVFSEDLALWSEQQNQIMICIGLIFFAKSKMKIKKHFGQSLKDISGRNM